MNVSLTSQYRFDASHALTHLPPSHPCHHLHGHSYLVEIEVTGSVDPATGFLIDYAQITAAVEPLIKLLDHRHLNDVEGLEIASTEYIARWFWQRLKPLLPILSQISVHESATTRCTYCGD